jgi:hypothetical protein
MTTRQINAKKGHQGFLETEKGHPASGLGDLSAAVGASSDTVLLHPDNYDVDFDGQTTALIERPWSNVTATKVGDNRVFSYTTYSEGDFYIHTEQHNARGIVSANVEQAVQIESLHDEERAAHEALVAKVSTPASGPEPEIAAEPQPKEYVSPYGAPSKMLAGNTGTPNRPVDFRDKRVQNGELFDTLAGEGGTTFHRRRKGVFAATPYAMRFQSSKEISDKEMLQAAQLIGYQYASTVRGEPMDRPVRDSPYSFVIAADTTKSPSDDLGRAIEDFERGLQHTLQYGSPKRTTDRAGAGTKDTRLVQGLGNYAPNLEIFYDDADSVGDIN